MKFLFVTTCERESCLLLIDIFRKFFNPQNCGHLDQLRVAISLFGIRVAKKPHGNPRGFLQINVNAYFTFCEHLTTGGLSGLQ